VWSGRRERCAFVDAAPETDPFLRRVAALPPAHPVTSPPHPTCAVGQAQTPRPAGGYVTAQPISRITPRFTVPHVDPAPLPPAN